jgi:geranylgeranylglycerol-phosphate geranylgeranyltransferase
LRQPITSEAIEMTKAKLSGLFRLFRLELSFTAGVCVLLGELLALAGLPSVTDATYGFLSIFCISATALILNDYFDLETDRINAPNRPLPSGLVTEAETILLSVVVALLGFMFSYFISYKALVVALAVWAIGFLYNWRLKRSGLLGNLFVAFSVGMTFIFGGIVVDHPFEVLVWYLALITFCVDLGEEIAADALDVEGDRRSGSRSLAVVIGAQKAMQVAAGVFGFVVVASFVPFILGWLTWLYLPVMVVWDAIVVYSVCRLLDFQRANRITDIRRIYLSGLGMFLIFIGIRLAS